MLPIKTKQAGFLAGRPTGLLKVDKAHRFARDLLLLVDYSNGEPDLAKGHPTNMNGTPPVSHGRYGRYRAFDGTSSEYLDHGWTPPEVNSQKSTTVFGVFRTDGTANQFLANTRVGFTTTDFGLDILTNHAVADQFTFRLTRDVGGDQIAELRLPCDDLTVWNSYCVTAGGGTGTSGYLRIIVFNENGVESLDEVTGFSWGTIQSNGRVFSQARSSSGFSTNDIALCGYINKGLTLEECRDIARNPYQFLKPAVERVLFKPSAGGPITGTGAIDLPVATLSGSGIVGVTASGAIDLPVATLAGSGVVAVPGTGAIDLPVATLDGSGVVSTDILGAGAIQLPVGLLAGAGVVSIPGSGAILLPVADLAGTGTVSEANTGAIDLPMAIIAGSGTVEGGYDGNPAGGKGRRITGRANNRTIRGSGGLRGIRGSGG